MIHIIAKTLARLQTYSSKEMAPPLPMTLLTLCACLLKINYFSVLFPEYALYFLSFPNILNSRSPNLWSSCPEKRKATAPPPTLGSRKEKKYPKELFKTPAESDKNKTMDTQVDVPMVQNLILNKQ